MNKMECVKIVGMTIVMKTIKIIIKIRLRIINLF